MIYYILQWFSITVKLPWNIWMSCKSPLSIRWENEHVEGCCTPNEYLCSLKLQICECESMNILDSSKSNLLKIQVVATRGNGIFHLQTHFGNREWLLTVLAWLSRVRTMGIMGLLRMCVGFLPTCMGFLPAQLFHLSGLPSRVSSSLLGSNWRGTKKKYFGNEISMAFLMLLFTFELPILDLPWCKHLVKRKKLNDVLYFVRSQSTTMDHRKHWIKSSL